MTGSKAAKGQVIDHDGKKYLSFKEGLATILFDQTDDGGNHEGTKLKKSHSDQQVFYNPIQQFNRDLTVLAIKAYGADVLERRKASWDQRLAKFAHMKRKRQQEASSGELPVKVARIDGGLPEAVADGPPGAGWREDSDIDNPTAVCEDESMKGQANTAEAPDHGAQIEATANGKIPTQAVPSDSLQETEDKTARVPFTILDALSASGLRALRYAHEIPFATSITAIDMSKSAVASIRINIDYNEVGRRVHAVQDDALAHMYSLVARELRRKIEHPRSPKSEKYDVIDLDPYGTAATFFDAALQSVRSDGGLICITCTDTGVWASNGWPEKGFALYGGATMKGHHSHEAGLRLILHALASSAARYGLTIEPLLSLSIDFYGRMFVRIERSPAAVKFNASKTMLVYNCDAGCGAWTTQPLLRHRPVQQKKAIGYKHGYAAGPTAAEVCEHCGTKTHVAGPMYAGRLHSPAFIKRVLEGVSEADPATYGTLQRIEGMLTTALEETALYPEATKEDPPGERVEAAANAASQLQAADAESAIIDPYPFFFIPSQLSAVLHCLTPSEQAIRGALIGLGYRATRSHCKPGSMKTDAPWSVIWRIMREWVQQKSPVKTDNFKPGMAGYQILGLGVQTGRSERGDGQRPVLESQAIVFDEDLGRYKEKKLVRYQQNPRENWGPMTRAKGT